MLCTAPALGSSCRCCSNSRSSGGSQQQICRRLGVRPWCQAGPSARGPSPPRAVGTATTTHQGQSLKAGVPVSNGHHLGQQNNVVTRLIPTPAPSFEELYTLGPELGKGCFATVYEVTERATGRVYAAKQLPKTRLRQTPAATAAAIDQEVRILRQLQGCHDVLQFRGLAESGDHVYILTELCSGGTLADYMRAHGPLTEGQAAAAMRSILSAIHACHCAGIEYGDLKPTNVLLRRPAGAGEPLDLVLADFGCSQFVGPLGRAQQSPGTPLFAAPEVMFKHNGLEADLWSAGVLLYHMLSDQWPFHAPEEKLSPNSVMRRALSAPILWGAPAWAATSQGARRLIERMLDREKHSRITAKEALAHPWVTAGGASWAGEE